MKKNIVDNLGDFNAYLRSLEEGTEVDSDVHEEKVYTLNLGDEVTTACGGVVFTQDEEYFGLQHFEIALGPANSKRLIEFLITLPAEPDED